MLKVLIGLALSALPYLVSAQDNAVSFAAAPAPAPSGVSAGSNKKIGMVISTLKDILLSVVNEQKQETIIFGKYVAWCDTETAAISNDLSETRTELANAKVLSEEQVSSIDSLKLFVKKSEAEIEETKDAIAQAVSLRTDENEKYTEEMQLNTQSLRQIDSAIKHVSKVNKQGGFLQNGVMKKLAVNQPGESSYVQGIMKGLKEKLSKSRAVLKKVEVEKVQMHNSFMETKGKSMKALSDSTVEKKILLAETVAKEAGNKRKVGKLTEEVNQLLVSSSKTGEQCMTTKQEWKVREADRTKEKAALSEAIRYLTESSFEQLSSVEEVVDKTDEEHASVVFATSFLQEVSDTKLSDNAFYAAASAELTGEDDKMDSHLRKESFNGVKNVVAKLIGSHQDSQKEEKTKKAYCEKEIADADDEKATTVDDLAAVSADIDKKSAEVTTLTDEVKSLYKSIDQIKTSLEAANKIRKAENIFYVATSKDRALAVKVLNQAKHVLQDFYSMKKDFLQEDGAAPAPAPARRPAPQNLAPKGNKKVASFGAVSMVQDIADDIAKEQKDATMAENEAASALAQLVQDSSTKTDDRHSDITERVQAKAKLGVQINTLKETKTQHSDDLKSINKQLKALHGSCDELLKFFDKRKKDRGFEVSQLRDVMDILSGSSEAVRSGLMQDDTDDAGESVASLIGEDTRDSRA